MAILYSRYQHPRWGICGELVIFIAALAVRDLGGAST
jgi:hypothetical protein